MSMLSDRGGRYLEGIRVVLRVVVGCLLFWLLVLMFDMMGMMTRRGLWRWNLN